MRIAIPKESAPGEARVAVVPETVKRLVARKLEVSVEAGAGEGALASDRDYQDAGARVEPNAGALYTVADLVVKVHAPTPPELARLREGQALISLLYPLVNLELVKQLAARRVTALATDAIPRTTLAQMMDVLSSQATIAGYRAVILAAHALPKLIPMLMTAAGTIPPAKVLILGAGVAGLQAIASARRLGAVVEAFDVRKVVKEQVESLGAKFVMLELETKDAEDKTGYAKAQSEDFYKRQQELMGKSVMAADVVITTALVPGQRAPLLIPEEMVRGMRPGSVIVDLAAEQGGNCALTQPGQDVVQNGVAILGPLNVPSTLPFHASQMYAKNVTNFLAHLLKDGKIQLDLNDELTRGPLVTHQGQIVHDVVKKAMQPEAKS